jgi:hypothetical protein
MINYNPSVNKSGRAKSVIKDFTTENVRGELYVCPNNCTARMVLLFVSNADGGTNVRVEWYRASDATHYFILQDKNLTASEFIQFSDSYIVLEPGDKIEITPSSNNTPNIHAFCTVEETFIPVG